MNAFHLLEYFLLMYSLVTIGLFDSSHTILFSFWKRNFTRKYPAEMLLRCPHIEPGLILTFSFFFSTSWFCLWLSPASLLPPRLLSGLENDLLSTVMWISKKNNSVFWIVFISPNYENLFPTLPPSLPPHLLLLQLPLPLNRHAASHRVAVNILVLVFLQTLYVFLG